MPIRKSSGQHESAQYWLMKSEPSECSVDDVLQMPDQTVPWFGVRNYQARNFMKNNMKEGDGVLFWHSSCAEPGIVGLGIVKGQDAYADETQFDPTSVYYDPKSTYENPRWVLRDIQILKKTNYLSIKALRQYPELKDMLVLKKGNRLSITPVSIQERDFILRLL
jgi:predicted RNA-binding protein with PUA-like domain